MIIGISGKSGSGKSFTSNYLSNKLNYKWLNLDIINAYIRDIYKEEIVGLVGDSSIVIESKIDSKLLGKILFNNKDLMDKYNEFIYLKQIEIINKEIKENKNIIIDTLFLPMMDIFNKCDYKILLIADDAQREKRVIKRDKITKEYYLRRIGNEFEYNKSEFDLVLINSNDKEFIKSLDLVVEKLKK